MKFIALGAGYVVLQLVAASVLAQTVGANAFGDVAAERHSRAYEVTRLQTAIQADVASRSTLSSSRRDATSMPSGPETGRSAALPVLLEEDRYTETESATEPKSKVTRVDLFLDRR